MRNYDSSVVEPLQSISAPDVSVPTESSLMSYKSYHEIERRRSIVVGNIQFPLVVTRLKRPQKIRFVTEVAS